MTNLTVTTAYTRMEDVTTAIAALADTKTYQIVRDGAYIFLIHN